MATCKDCVHVDVCCSYLSTAYNKCKLATPDFKLLKNIECDECQHFQDSSRFVGLPCKVGDTVYLLHNVYNNILAYSVSKILINSGEPIIEIVEAERRIHTLYLSPARELNKSLFLTKEQAEQALKERESNAERNDI